MKLTFVCNLAQGTNELDILYFLANTIRRWTHPERKFHRLMNHKLINQWFRTQILWFWLGGNPTCEVPEHRLSILFLFQKRKNNFFKVLIHRLNFCCPTESIDLQLLFERLASAELNPCPLPPPATCYLLVYASSKFQNKKKVAARQKATFAINCILIAVLTIPFEIN